MATALDFSEFYRVVHGYPPFPWQARLARRVVEQGRWPELLDLPTGTGKTSALDIALFALAVDPVRAPRRTVLVVDRRVIVDQAAVHARRILEALEREETPVTRRIASALRDLWSAGPDEPPFAIAVLRGGMPRDDGWARRPDQPLLGVSTVDQVGSRLLFRGYGVSDRMASVHAGLFGNDTLFLLDEVHLSVPFAETLQSLRRRWRRPTGLPDRWGVVEMSATPSNTEADRFQLQEETDRANDELSRRLRAHKRARLIEVKVRGDETSRRTALATACKATAVEFVRQGMSAVAVVVNRVDTARIVRAQLEGESGVDVVLLTGRMRPLDRDRVVDESFLARVRARRSPRATEGPLIVVATQCIEAGADFDMDALVTECASLDALRQRFGRVDRLGDLSARDGVDSPVRGAVLLRSDQAQEDCDDPIYGPALSRTWSWLRSKGEEVDFGLDALQPPDDPTDLIAPQLHAPVLLPAHLDAWAQTSPKPRPDPDVSLWLHGPDRGVPDVHLVWRADVQPGMLDAGDSDELESLIALVGASPPGSLEALPIPIYAARSWLAEAGVVDVADVQGARSDDEVASGGRRALRWAGDSSEIVTASELRPGDTLVVPSTYGGIRHESWDPSCQDPVTDLGDICQWRLRRRATLRLNGDVLTTWFPDQGPSEEARAWLDRRPRPSEDEERDLRAEVAAWVQEAPAALPDTLAQVVRELAPFRLMTPAPDQGAQRDQAGATGLVLVARRRRRRDADEAEVSSEDDGASFPAVEVSLRRHCHDVKRYVEKFANTLGISSQIREDLALAAWLHDVGKADPRFQQLLVGGSEVRLAALDAPIAKSALPSRDAQARAIARRRAGYPRGYRHELLTVAMLQASPRALDEARDGDLVLHLIGSHHGWCRPFAPPVEDSNTVDEVVLEHNGLTLKASTRHGLARLDSGVSDRFWDLVGRYGRWGLAWLEALMRLADHRASEAEQEGRDVE